MKQTLQQLANEIHILNEKWWTDINTKRPIKRNKYELLALAISEVSECLEGERKNLMDDKLPHRKMAEVEMADTYIRLLDYSVGFKVPVFSDKLLDEIPSNKGEALYCLIDYIVKIGSSNTSSFLCLAIASIKAYCEMHGYDLDGAVREKLVYNATREDHTHEARRIAGGKQF